LLNIWITSVVSVVLYTTSTSPPSSSPRHRHLHPPSLLSSSSSCSLPTLTSLSSLFAPYLTTLLFVWIVYSSIFLSSLLSFFLSPEYQSFSYGSSTSASFCSTPPQTPPFNSSLHSLTFPRYQSGPLMSELLYHPCEDNPSVLIALRKYRHPAETAAADEEDLEVEIMSRVSPGHDLLLRLDLQHWEGRYWERERRTQSHTPQQRVPLRYEGISSDGWWVSYTPDPPPPPSSLTSLQGMIRRYQWLTPLSANFMPVSDSLTLTASVPGPFPSPPHPSPISWLSSFFPPSAPSPPLDESTHSPLAFLLTCVPLSPTGVVQYNDKLEWLVHRSHSVDDEKGLEEALRDPSRGRFLLRMKYREATSPPSLPRDEERDPRRVGVQERSSSSPLQRSARKVTRRLVVVSGADHHRSLQPM
jgi:hypothetical protein